MSIFMLQNYQSHKIKMSAVTTTVYYFSGVNVKIKKKYKIWQQDGGVGGSILSLIPQMP